jgi:class 3 adenylate cyclase
MSETRKLAAILVADVVGFSRLAGADEDRTLLEEVGLDDGVTALTQLGLIRATDDSRGLNLTR